MAHALTTGALTKISMGIDVQEPVLQLYDISVVGSQSKGKERYRGWLSDGVSRVQAMLAQRLNPMVVAKHITEHSVITLNAYSFKPVSNKPIVIILNVSSSDNGTNRLIGSPEPLRMGPTQSTQFDQPAAPAPDSARPVLEHLLPIAALSPYQPRWTIVARMLDPQLVQFKNNSGCILTATLLDEAGDSIAAVSFNETAQVLLGRISPGQVYRISRGDIRKPNKSFGNGAHAYEVIFTNDTVFELERDQALATSISSHVPYDFSPIETVSRLKQDDFVDVLCVVGDVSPAVTIHTKAGGVIAKREVALMDQSDHAISIVLWGNDAELFHVPAVPQPSCIAVRGAKVVEFAGTRTLVVTSKSSVELNPAVIQVQDLRTWYSRTDGKSVHTDLSLRDTSKERTPVDRVTIKELTTRSKVLPLGERTVVEVLCCVKQFSGGEPYYAACPLEFEGRTCNKKVREQESGLWYCQRCEQTVPRPQLRYILRFQAYDATASEWVTAFNEAGSTLLGQSADSYAALLERGNSGGVDATLRGAEHRALVLRCIAGNEMNLKGELRLRVVASHASRPSFAKEAARLVASIRELEQPQLSARRRNSSVLTRE